MTKSEAEVSAANLRALGGLWCCVTKDRDNEGEWTVHVTVTVETLEG